MSKKVLGIIGARGGSQGVPGKNIMPVGGKPLIGWSVERGLQSGVIDDMVVSTDDAEIARVAESFGAKIPFMRPAELATAGAGKFQVWQHALNECEKIYGVQYDMVVDMDCTNPLLDAEDLRGIVSAFRTARAEKGVDVMFTVSAAHRNPYFNLCEEDAEGLLHLSKRLETNVVGRQGAPKAWDIVAGYYILDPGYLRRAQYMMDGRVMGYPVSREKSVDIDEPLDVELVEFFMKRRKAG
jgi:CMP-N-acetylneuraminic acid synthetase